ncbi:MAG: isoprenoid biosynthesis glyoxalase ElbB [Alphaproteobacteria bacterium]|nr:isoprenoid biosynthesis glyoxalase ElbB [Alphaproteobacteria bacterium]
MSEQTKIAVVLSGCGVFDGTEIHEAVLTMLAIDQHGAEYQCFAPDMNHHHVIDHITGYSMGEERNVLVESARIARGNVMNLSEYNPADYDAIIFPGGFGAAKNLCTFAVDGTECNVNLDVEKAIKATHKAGKPIGALCIAPALIAKVLKGIEITIGNNEEVIDGLERMGAKHSAKSSGDICVDMDNRIVTSPCYMLDKSIADVAISADNAVEAILEMI